MHGSITRINIASGEASTSDHSTTMNARTLVSCEASENGIPCWHHADIDYITSENITRHLCKQCYNKLWKIVRASLQARVQNRLCDEKGRVA